MIVPTRGKQTSLAGFGILVSIWEEESSQERASVWEMSDSRSMDGVGGRREGKLGKGKSGWKVTKGKPGFQREFPKE